jgi:hypothetical protein
LTGRVFRLSPRYELREGKVPVESVPEGTAALLWPVDGGELPLRALDRATVELLRALSEPAPVERDADALVPLVLDGVLEIEGDDGAMVGGPRAAPAVLETLEVPDPPADDRLGAVSRTAIRQAAAAGLDDPRELSLWLYLFNRLPLTRRVAARWPTDAHVRDELTRAARGRPFAVVADERGGPWMRLASRPVADARHKLYVSPRPEHLVDAFATTLTVLAGHDCDQLKVGATHAGVLRPDKLVCYFADRDAVVAAAADLSGALAGVPAHGAPFTAALTPDGLLSRGRDPRSATTPLHPWFDGDSWRLSVCSALGAAVTHATAAGCELDPATYALLRVALDGVDTLTWEPAA